MSLDDKYEVRVVVIEKKDDIYGDVYSDYKKFKMEHPYSEYEFGFCVVNKETGLIPDGCNDWNDSVEEAVWDYIDNVYEEER